MRTHTREQADVEEALRLFKVSTLAAGQSSPMLLGAGVAATEEVKRAEVSGC